MVPQAASRPAAGEVWVVPNPYRAWADWNRPSTLGDPLTRHIEFMGLPSELCTVKVWTVAGDSWNLITRNGQEVASGVYLFTVDSPLGRQAGRFVVVR